MAEGLRDQCLDNWRGVVEAGDNDRFGRCGAHTRVQPVGNLSRVDRERRMEGLDCLEAIVVDDRCSEETQFRLIGLRKGQHIVVARTMVNARLTAREEIALGVTTRSNVVFRDQRINRTGIRVKAKRQTVQQDSAYQIVAVESILLRIGTATNNNLLGSVAAGGYIWHTTGSGKTLTSFKAAQLACALPGVDKVLFVVDRKDLDYQTMREYERFEKGAANSNASTSVLRKQLSDPNARIIITTIQKLSRFVATAGKHPVYGSHVVVIFDECHRSQFGDMHAEITKAFKRYNLFGFTGTPIFAENSGSGGNPLRRTTEQAFGDKLHTYTIVDAINDRNVLPFRIDYINTIKTADAIKDKQVSRNVRSTAAAPMPAPHL